MSNTQFWNSFQSLLAQLANEDSLLSWRTSWLLLGQIVLVLAYRVLDSENLLHGSSRRSSNLIALLGMLTTIFVFGAILASIKEYIELRTQIYALIGQNPELPLRALPQVGIGAGLLCPPLLCLAALCSWSYVCLRKWWPTTLLTLSGFLFASFVVVDAQDEVPKIFSVPILLAGCVTLITAIPISLRVIRETSS